MATISRIDTFIVDVPTIRPHVLAMATMHRQSIVIVRLLDSDGAEGIGEGHDDRRPELWRRKPRGD